ncbi:hypothetical protein [Streptomyces sp. KS_5]|uniref:hypothetical protein n=1 Tax=Streptomyces TaxID=1883 RepID=UPI000898FC1D|nr:hypothetical protein [Streptomyces sp. KS_5]SEE68954.1 hypothetical protein SAMN05428938_8105 [Streptomyces sp. KS_5]
MNPPRSGRINVLILRAWREHGHPSAVRVRVIEVSGQSETPVATAADADQACEVVRAWLDRLQPPGPAEPDSTVTDR